MNAFKALRKEMINKYWDAIVALYSKYGMDTFVSFEMLVSNAKSFVAGEEIKYPIDVDVDYAAINEEAKELYAKE